MVVAIAKAMEERCLGVMCASTGNTSASAAAYSAYCGLTCWVLIPKGEVALGKLAQAMAYGARIILVDGNFDAALALVRQFTETSPITLVNSVNQHRIEGQKTASFEVSDVLGDAPDYLFIPVGNAGNITAYWRGFVEYHQLGRNDSLPKMMGFQAEGAAPIVLGKPVPYPQTIASAIRIGNPASWKFAERARDQSGGVIDSVSDDEILDAYRLLASQEGIFGEPASAASVAGLLKMSRAGLELRGKRAVCVITGTGLKDPDLAVSSAQAIRWRFNLTWKPSRRRSWSLLINAHDLHADASIAAMSVDSHKMNSAAIEVAIGAVLKYVDEDSAREGLWRTPQRVAEMYGELFSGVGKNPADEIDAIFSDDVSHDPVLVRGLQFYSMCEHHLLPFFGQASLVYIPNRHIAGISKIARALDTASRRLQVQERLTSQLADAVVCRVRPLAVACRLEAEHLCMSMRGVQKPGHRMVTTAVRSGDQMAGYSNRDLLAMLES